MSKPPRQCVFCGGRPLSDGHIWPGWMTETLPAKAPTHKRQFQVIGEFDPKPEILTLEEKTKQGPVGASKPRNTCLTCNGGWMSRIEDKSKPIVVPLILEERNFLLDTPCQIVIASLICLISMRVCLSRKETLETPLSERDALRLNGVPPQNWKIWIGPYVDADPSIHLGRHQASYLSSKLEGKVGAKPDTQITTFVVGKFCAHAFSAPLGINYDFESHPHALSQIWPPTYRYIEWDRIIAIDRTGFEHIASSMARDIPYDPNG